MSQFKINAERAKLGDVRHRKNIRNFSQAEVDAYRTAFRSVYAITNRDDNRGFQYWAGKHGRPEALCDHGRLFLSWHRAYLVGLEKAVQYHTPNVTLSYWNWTGPATVDSNGPPGVVTEPTLPDGSANPLAAGPIKFRDDAGNLIDRLTQRGNRTTPTFAQLKSTVDAAFGQEEFLAFQGEISGPHGGLHVRVGGDMGAFDFAGYDPVFWMHHSNVDRQWAQWQRLHPNAQVPRLSFALPGMDMTVGTTVDHRSTLGYDYVANECFEMFADRNDVSSGMAAFNASPTQFSVADLADGFASAMLEFHNVGHPIEGTREIRVFINQPDADAETATEGNDHYAGSRVLLGKTMCFGEDGHCALPPPREKFDVWPRAAMKPIKIYMNVTRTLKKPDVVSAEAGKTIVTLVVVDQEGAALPLNSVRMDGLSFIARD